MWIDTFVLTQIMHTLTLKVPLIIIKTIRGVAQLGRTLRSGLRGRIFKSCRLDQSLNPIRDRIFIFVPIKILWQIWSDDWYDNKSSERD